MDQLTRDELIKLVNEQKKRISNLEKDLHKSQSSRSESDGMFSETMVAGRNSPYSKNLSSQLLTDEYEKLKKEKKIESMRDFANHLGIAVSNVSEYMSGLRQISLKQGKKIAQSLELCPANTLYFTKAIEAEVLALKKFKESIKEIVKAHEIVNPVPDSELGSGIFNKLSTWYHLAMAELLNNENKKWSADDISKVLNLTDEETEDSLSLLLELGLIEADGSYYSASKSQTFFQTCPKEEFSLMMKDLGLDVLRKCQDVFEELPIVLDNAEQFVLALRVNPEKISLAKKMINSSMWNIAKTLSEDSSDHEVYFLTAELFPVSR